MRSNYSMQISNAMLAMTLLLLPLSVDIVPLPPFRLPCQMADALRCMNPPLDLIA